MVNLLIVESPGKIKKLKTILGQGWDVKASVGHIRQLANDGEDALGFAMQAGKIDCHYVPRDTRAQETIANLKGAARRAERVFLAADPDREGETIAWHVAQVLGLRQPQRVIYQEITETAVRRAIAQPRPLDSHLVDAGRCRDCLDKLVGYKGSPLIWRLNNGAKSVGRVQSATLHLVCQREREILAFVPVDYWSVFVDYAEGFRAYYHGRTEETDGAANRRTGPVPAGAEPEEGGDETCVDDTGQRDTTRESTRVLSQAGADELVAMAEGRSLTIAQTSPHQVIQVQGKLSNKKPPAPFTTSSLQQVAGSRLKFSPEQTMQIAQKLYEAGLITYMRTDSVQLSPEFCAATRDWLQAHDPDNVPKAVAKQRSAKDAQEAHEAIRPTDVHRASADLKLQLSEAEFKLYVLIWMRAVASQCKPAQLRKSMILTESATVQWKATGQVVVFAGYAKYWQDLNGDHVLPSVAQGQTLTLEQAGSEQKQTKPPSRYTEAKLVQVMEKRGIGRPSTYAPTVKVLKEREYVDLISGKLHPTERGLAVDEFLGQALPDLIDPAFTADMESTLDAIAQGQQEWQGYLTHWYDQYFQPALSKAIAGLPPAEHTGPQRELERSRTKCPQCQKAMGKVPTKKVKKKYFLKCDDCKGPDGRSLVMFWSEREKQWQAPSASTPGTLQATTYPCPVCQKALEQYAYQKDGQTKQLLRCSDVKARGNPQHQDVVYFLSQGRWWSPKFGELKVESGERPN
jgi:DNA topoisomerase-1